MCNLNLYFVDMPDIHVNLHVIKYGDIQIIKCNMSTCTLAMFTCNFFMLAYNLFWLICNLFDNDM